MHEESLVATTKTKRTNTSSITPARAVAAKTPSASHGPEPSAPPPFVIVGIGASAGGLEAFKQMLHALPADTGMAFVYVQHLDPHHASLLSEILARATAIPVTEARHDMALAPNHMYVMPPNTNMVVTNATLRLSPRGVGQHHPIDEFLRSLAADQGDQAIGVILSGTATDGTLGLGAIKGEGGITFVQDDSAQQTSMPHSAIAAGVVDFVLPPKGIAKEIARIARHPYLHLAPQDKTEQPAAEGRLDRVLEIMRHGTGVDFSHYKFNTLYRRITRRMVLHKLDGMAEYERLLRDNTAERAALYQDILISVTRFFRNPETFDLLKTKVYARLVQEHARNEPVRIWVLGCSTGEEAYSIAMSFAEYTESLGRHVPVQIFATDLNGACVDRARAGVYTKDITQDVSPERLRHFFVEIDGHYRVAKPIRDACVFARHNVLTDPPFSRVDLISCRNLLIYLEPVLQQRVMPLLHYALKPAGFLWLGGSETIGPFRDSFHLEDIKHKIYSKNPHSSLPGTPLQALPALDRAPARPERAPPPERIAVDPQKQIDRLLLARYAPPGVLVNAEWEILQFRGDTGLYLAPGPGKANFNLLKMLREGLLAGVRGAILRARKSSQATRERGLRVKSNGGYRAVEIEAMPVKGGNLPPDCVLVLFHEPAAAKPAKTPKASGRKPRGARAAQIDEADLQLERTKQDLVATREYLQSLIEQQEAANEELQSANEEIQSANEELQSVNEELETSKEEIQSSNEELATLNEELQHRNLDLNQANNDLVNFIGSVQMAIVMLDPDLRIRRFTPSAEKLLNLIPTDIGRPVSDIKLKIDLPELERLLAETIDTVSTREQEVRDRDGRWYSLRIRPYKTLDNKIDGAVLVLVDVDALKRAEQGLRRLTVLFDQAFEPMFMWELDGPITYWNKGAEEFYGYPRAQALGCRSHQLLKVAAPEIYFDALRATGRWKGELTQTQRDGSQVTVDSHMVLAHEPGGPAVVIETNLPIAERHARERALAERTHNLVRADSARNQFLAMLAHELRSPLAPLRNAAALLRMAGADAATTERAKDMIDRQLGNLGHLVDDLLDVARVTQGHVQLRQEVLDLSKLLQRSVDTCRAGIDARSQTLEANLPPEPLWVSGDALRLEQVFTNLLNNASKYTPTGGHLWLSAERAAPAAADRATADAAQIAVHIRDDGIGISADALPHVFDLFMQADHSPERTNGGLGIGLTLVRRLVELHGGDVKAESAGSGQGSEFTVRLSAAPAPASERSPTPRDSDTPATSPRRILVVDDNTDTATSMAMLLELLGHDVRVTHGGPAALDAVDGFHPQVVVLDVGLPCMSGHEVAQRLRALPGGQEMLLVAVSGYGQPDDIQQARAAGFDRHFVKPMALEDFQKLLAGAPSEKE